MIPISAEQYLTTIWNAFTKGKGPIPIRIDADDSLFTAFEIECDTYSRFVDIVNIGEQRIIPFKTARMYNTGMPGWGGRISSPEPNATR